MRTERTGPPGPVVLELAGITKRFGELLANDAIDLVLRAGEILALLGENGAGKTTLMNILFGHYVADSGEVRVGDGAGGLRPLPPGSPHAALTAGIGMVHQHFTLATNLSVHDNIVLGTQSLWRPWPQRRRAALEALMADSGLQVPLDARVGSLSVGERQRVEILKALYRNARILVLDEPTAVLTPQEADRLFEVIERLAGQGLAVIFISHKLPEVMRLAGRVAVLRGGRKVAEMPTAGSSPAALAEAMVGRSVPERRRERLAPGPALLELVDVEAAPEHGRAIEGVRITIHAHEIVGIAGVSGNGQQALSSVIAGTLAPTRGSLRVLGQPWPGAVPRDLVHLGLGRIPEDRHAQGVVGTLPIMENAVLETYRDSQFQSLGAVRRGDVRTHARKLMAAFDVRAEGPDQRTGLLSGGNIQKVILGRVLERQPRLILADQPTRGLDVGAVAYVQGRLLEARKAGAGVLLISEDLEELLQIADRIAVMFRGQLGEALPTGSLGVRELGLMMAGQHRHAA